MEATSAVDSTCNPFYDEQGSKKPRFSVEIERIYWPGNYRAIKLSDICTKRNSRTNECIERAMRPRPPPSSKKKTHLKVVTIQSTPFVDYVPKPPGGQCNTSDRVEDLKFQVPCTHTNATTEFSINEESLPWDIFVHIPNKQSRILISVHSSNNDLLYSEKEILAAVWLYFTYNIEIKPGTSLSVDYIHPCSDLRRFSPFWSGALTDSLPEMKIASFRADFPIVLFFLASTPLHADLIYSD
ncbi:hypothetical protein ACTXT7_003201 [Hymenolepis weldensis]